MTAKLNGYGPLERERRHVAEAEKLVRAQRLRVRRLQARRMPTSLAKRVLATMENSLRLMRDDLALRQGLRNSPPRREESSRRRGVSR